MARATNHGIVSAESRSQLEKRALDAHFFFSVGSCQSNPVFLSRIPSCLTFSPSCELRMGPLGCICLITLRRLILDLAKDRDGGAAWAASRFRDDRPHVFVTHILFNRSELSSALGRSSNRLQDW